MGTPGYMSPERVEGEPVGPPGDIFSLGCVLAYAATGQPPFGEAASGSFAYRVVHGDPDLALLSPDLRQVVAACLRKDPAERPGAGALIAMLAQRAGGGTGSRPAEAGGDSPGAGAGRAGGSFWPEPAAGLIAAAQAEQELEGQPAAFAASASPAAAVPPASASPVTHVRVPGELTPPMPQPGGGPGDTLPISGAGAPPPGYHPAQRRPAAAEIPGNVAAAIRLMYAGFAVSAIDVVLAIIAIGQYNAEASAHSATSGTTSAANEMAGAAAIAVAANLLGLIAWTSVAAACRRGDRRARTASATLLALYSVCVLVVCLVTRNDPGVLAATAGGWAIGLATVIALGTEQARGFFDEWRRR
jgi:hypothetical protein